MIEIETIRKYFEQEDVLVSEHAAMRFRQRGLRIKDIRFAVNNGQIIEQYPEDFPYPSYMKCMSCKMEEMEMAKNTYFAQLPNCYVIIENVPCYVCPQCGEVYYKAAVLEKIEDLLERLEHIASKIFIVDYSQAA